MREIVLIGHISLIIVLMEGILSFFSPCVLPLLPIYMGYLLGSGQEEDGQLQYKKSRIMGHTVCFILGISTAFFLLGISFTALGTFFYQHRVLFSRVGGIVIILLGLYQLGFFESTFLQREHRLPFRLQGKKMNPLVAFVMGFTFSFAWTPCVGPALSAVLIMASGAQSALLGNLLVLTYAVGFVLPFLVLGLFTTQTLNFLKKRQNWLRYTIKVGGALLIVMGIMVFTGWMNGITSYLSEFDGFVPNAESAEVYRMAPEQSLVADKREIPIVDFELTDQYGEVHRLSDYEGKVVFLNFWTSWCSACKMETPHIQSLYETYGSNQEDVVFLVVANPSSKAYPRENDSDIETIKGVLEENGYTFPVLFDTTGAVLDSYRITAFPTTFMIDETNHVFGYVAGALTKDMIVNIIEQTQASTEEEKAIKN